MKWAVELLECGITYKSRAFIKGQALANFFAKFTNVPKIEVVMEPVESLTWSLFVDGYSREVSSRD